MNFNRVGNVFIIIKLQTCEDVSYYSGREREREGEGGEYVRERSQWVFEEINGNVMICGFIYFIP